MYRDGCHVGYASTKAPDCVYGDPRSDTEVVLFGDSHAAQWFPALERLAGERHWKLISLTKASCKVPAVSIVNGGGPYASCDTCPTRCTTRRGTASRRRPPVPPGRR
ncbi:SGNH hydrolase domain-containing protein [Streptomyces sp. NPDC021224]|uniref:SGNH hydrolase domain-containing protein n=1 Tax=unclassified Streptomyces TaxID=2593676 RepID=UPI0037873E73